MYINYREERRLQREVGSPARTSPASQDIFGDMQERYSYLPLLILTLLLMNCSKKHPSRSIIQASASSLYSFVLFES
ncbi:unnamed protein product, partial [Vitis vinifera]